MLFKSFNNIVVLLLKTMKRLFYLIPLVILFSCGGPNKEKPIEKPLSEKVNDTCHSFLLSYLNDPSSYSSIKWEKLDSFYVDSLFTSGPYRNQRIDYVIDSTYTDLIKREMKRGNISEKFNPYEEDAIKYRPGAKNYKYLLDSLNKEFKNEFVGYTVIHEFRSKNKFGALQLRKAKFWVGRNFEIINGSEIMDIEKEKETKVPE